MCDKLTIKDVKYPEEAWCEHCYLLEPFSPVIEGGADFCLDCMMSGEDIELSEEDLKQIEITSTKKKIEFYESQLESLKDYYHGLVSN